MVKGERGSQFLTVLYALLIYLLSFTFKELVFSV